jgi:RHS repeat-associated protein
VVAAADGTTFNFASGPSYDAGNDVTVDLPGKVEDTNGNYITITGSNTSPGQYQITDTAGRTAISSSGFGQTGNTVSVSGLANPYTITWSTVDADFALGDSGNFSNGSCFGFGNASTGGAEPVITEIALPNGQAFSFSYDPTYGLLSKVVYPDGGFVEYSWAVDSLSEDAQFTDSNGVQNGCNYHHGQVRLTERQVSFDGSTIALQQDFSYATNWDPSNPEIWDTKTTTVTTHDLVRGVTYTTRYTYAPSVLETNATDVIAGSFSPQVPVGQSIQYYGAQGELLKTVNETWAAPDLLASQQVVWPNGKTSERDFAYGSPILPELTEEDDYGSGGKGAEIRCRAITYASFPTTPIYPAGPSIADRPASVVTYGGGCASGTIEAQTDYAYDQTAPSGPTNIVGKDYSSGNYGNLTTESRWVSTTNSFLNTTMAYDVAGQLLTVQNPLDAALGDSTETFSYADAYAGGNPASPTDAYPTTITDALGHTREYTWNLASGELASSKGENGNTTTYAYSDPFGRLTQVDYPPPNGGETTYAYNDAAPSPSVTISKEISPGNWLTTVSVRDGMGHAVETETTSDPAGTDYVATTFDGLGQVLTVTNPYRSTSDPTYGLTTYAYDGLGRTTSVTHPGGSVVNTTYTGRATEVADEGNGSYNVTRISQVDGLGRLVSVCEVDGSSMAVGGGATPVACGQDIAATGFLTTYGYDALGDSTAVSQSGLNSRTFAYDSLSRLITADNPESGTISYNYDTAACGAVAAPGELTCRTDARGVTTAYGYDADSRVLTKTYSDGTPEVQFVYDESSPWGVTLGNPVGRMVLAQTLVDGATSTGETFSYDSMGRVAMNQECVSLDCGSGNYQLNYSHDLLGDTTSATNGEGVTLSYGYNNAVELTAITSSLSDSNHPGTLFSAPGYDAGGQLTGFAYGTNGNQTETDTYNDRMQLTSRSVTGAAGVNPTSGTGSISISGAEQSVQVPSTHSTGSITINGTESAHEVIKCPTAPSGGATPEIGCTYTWYYNQGVVNLSVNGVTASAGYGQGSTDASVASALASAVNNDGSMPVTASLSSATVTLTSKGIGTGVNYSLGTSCTYSISYWTACSFSGSLSGSAMTGGSDVTDYDYGTVSAVINGQPVSASYGQNDSDSTVAANLATAINNNSSYATASASGSSLAITARGTGAGTNYSLSASSATSDSGQFSSPSFSASASGSSLTGGQNGQGSGAYSVTGITYAPDGDVTGATDSVNGEWQYEYDPLNRLVEACETNCASPTNAAGYVYDRFGNRWQENALAGTIWSSAQLTFDANNRIAGANYDASGDLLADAAGHTYIYNAQHRIVSADGGNIQYVYNAFGQRVEKSVGGVAKYYLYDPAGRAVTVLDQNGNWLRGEIFAGGRHIATYANGTAGTTYFDYSDWLGTLRMSATLAGYEDSECTSGPFGEGLNCSSPTPLQFTGQQHDSETGLDDFPARYYSPTWDVWTTPDWSSSPSAVPYADFSAPQSLDLYVYALGNPETNTDPDGHWCFIGIIGTTCAAKNKNPQPAGPRLHLCFGGDAVCVGHGRNQKIVQGLGIRDESGFIIGATALAGAAVDAVAAGIRALIEGSAPAAEGAPAALTERGATGAATAIRNVTTGNSILNLEVDLTPEEFGSDLEEDGYTRAETSDGHVQYAKGDRTYTIYDNATSTGGPSAQVKVGARVVSKIRLKP